MIGLIFTTVATSGAYLWGFLKGNSQPVSKPISKYDFSPVKVFSYLMGVLIVLITLGKVKNTWGGVRSSKS